MNDKEKLINKIKNWTLDQPIIFMSIKEPEPPLSIIVREGATKFCKICHSSIYFIDYFLFGIYKSGCINPKCKNYYENK